MQHIDEMSNYIAPINLLNIYCSVVLEDIQVFREQDMVTETWCMVTEQGRIQNFVKGEGVHPPWTKTLPGKPNIMHYTL